MRESIRLTVPMGGDSPTTAHLIAASLGLQVHMSVDRLDDLRLALDEAIAELVSLCPEAAEISCEFTLDDSAVHIRLDARTTTGRTPDHHGLGLSIAQAIAEAHGGRLQAGEAPGGGCRMLLELPLRS